MRLLVVAAAVAAAFAPLPHAAIERLYSQGLYAWLQPRVTAASSLVPVALLDVAGGILLAALLAVLVRRWRTAGFLSAFPRTAVSLVVLLAILYLWFLLFWGLNYRRLPLEEKLAYDRAKVTRREAVQLAHVAVGELNSLARLAPSWSDDTEPLVQSLAALQGSLGAPAALRVASPKSSVLMWYFRYAAIDGMTNPFFLEIILHPDLLSFERPFVLAHEWAHLAGYADEGEANFIAWLACVRGTPATRYSGWLAAYQQVAGQLPRDDRQLLRAALVPSVIADLRAISERVARSSPRVRTAARGAYDTYLRANRIEEGIASYDAAVRLMLGTTFDAAWTPALRP